MTTQVNPFNQHGNVMSRRYCRTPFSNTI